MNPRDIILLILAGVAGLVIARITIAAWERWRWVRILADAALVAVFFATIALAAGIVWARWFWR
jgi:hypothetical protein